MGRWVRWGGGGGGGGGVGARVVWFRTEILYDEKRNSFGVLVQLASQSQVETRSRDQVVETKYQVNNKNKQNTLHRALPAECTHEPAELIASADISMLTSRGAA
jgi:hypothetical protein